MVLKPQILDAFSLLGIDPDADLATATKAYKRQALLHHPDRNHADQEATQRFQQIGAAWNICQRHFDNPAWSHIQGASSSFSRDDDIPLDEDDLFEFYMFMFTETLFERYSRASGQRYRYEHSGRARSGVTSFSGGFAEFQSQVETQVGQSRNSKRQRKENEEYERRMRELELEIQEEERERQRTAKKLKADEDRRVNGLEHAFQSAYAGNSCAVKKAVLDFDLDVNAPRKRVKQTKKQDELLQVDSLLHATASHCDETLVMFLIERGAKATALNKDQLTPFHTAIKAGNTRVVQFIMDRRGKSFDGYHPSKASPSGRTPLQLAIESGVPSVVELLVKDATTHDVERCWRQEPMSEEIKEILCSKKGFIPPNAIVVDHTASISRKTLRQQELSQQKESRIAEEMKRAEINRQKRQERAAKRAEKDRQHATRMAVEEARLNTEMEERQRLENERRVQEESRAKVLRDGRLKAEAEARAQAVREARLKEEKEDQMRLQAEDEARAQVAHETKIKEERMCLERGRSQNAEVGSPAQATQQTKLGEKEVRTQLGRGRSSRTAKDTKLRTNEFTKTSSSTQSVSTSEAVPAADQQNILSANALTPEERKKLRYAKLKEKRKLKLAEHRRQKETPTGAEHQTWPAVGDGVSPSEDTKKVKPPVEHQKQIPEAALRRRAEQSARDKERHRRILEERGRIRSEAQVQSTAIPATVQPHLKHSAVFSMPMEDIQTCVVPDDLFSDERPIPPRDTDGETFVRGEPRSEVNKTGKRWNKYPRRPAA